MPIPSHWPGTNLWARCSGSHGAAGLLQQEVAAGLPGDGPPRERPRPAVGQRRQRNVPRHRCGGRVGAGHPPQPVRLRPSVPGGKAHHEGDLHPTALQLRRVGAIARQPPRGGRRGGEEGSQQVGVAAEWLEAASEVVRHAGQAPAALEGGAWGPAVGQGQPVHHGPQRLFGPARHSVARGRSGAEGESGRKGARALDRLHTGREGDQRQVRAVGEGACAWGRSIDHNLKPKLHSQREAWGAQGSQKGEGFSGP